MDTIGKYEIIEKIGSGGFGEVFKGFDPFIKRHVAIKTCRSNDEEIRTRFFQEAEIAGNLHHRNITTVYDFGVHEELPYLIQEYLSGEDLALKIKRRDSLPFAEKLYYLLQIIRGLEHAHANGVVHRDIKPANIRILENGTAKIMDFGIAKLAQRESSLTQTGMTLGTAAYLAPEQIRGDAVDQRTDIFSFGVMTYELLCYERPFKGEQISAVLYQILHGEAPELKDPTAEAPPEMAKVIACCLEKDADRRYRDTEELLQDLERVQKKAKLSPGPAGTSQTIPLRERPVAPASFAEEITPSKPLPTAPWPTKAPETHNRLDLVELQNTETGTPAQGPTVPIPEYRESIAVVPKRRSPWLLLLLLPIAAIALGGWWATAEPGRLGSLLAKTGLAEPEQELALTTTDPDAARVDPPSQASGSDPGERDPARQEAIPLAGEGREIIPSTRDEAKEEVAQKKPSEVEPTPPPPAPAKLSVQAAPWAERMTVRFGNQTRLYTLDRPLVLSLSANLYRLSFKLEHFGYAESATQEVRLQPGEELTLAPPIRQPGNLSVRARPGLPQAQILVSGIDRGTSPLNGLILKPGEYVIVIRPVPRSRTDGESAGREPPAASDLIKSVSLEPGLETIVTFDLEKMSEPVVRVKSGR